MVIRFKEFVGNTQLQEKAQVKRGHNVGGFNYEKQMVAHLKRHGLMSKQAQPAGARSDAPDAHVNVNGQHNLEIKQNKRSMMGQLELKYHPEKGWHVGDKSRKKYPHTTAHIEKSGFLKDVNKQWSKPSGDYDKDLKMGNVYKHVEGTDAVAAHYHDDRKTPYMHIGNQGTFHLKKDTAGLGTTKLKGGTQLRARMKYRSTDKKTGIKRYGPGIVMSLIEPKKSSLDLEKSDHIKNITSKNKPK